MKQEYWVTPLDKPGLLEVFMRALVGDSQIALEGNLATCDFSKVEDCRVTAFGDQHRVDDGRESDYQVFELNSESLA